jgi:hypothetical protein
MITLHKAAQQALEFCEFLWREAVLNDYAEAKREETELALRAALAQEEHEPVLVVEKEPDYMSRGHFYEGSKPFIDPTEVWKLPIGTKLYTAPPGREWQGLTEEEIDRWTPEIHPVIRAIEQALKEKNA